MLFTFLYGNKTIVDFINLFLLPFQVIILFQYCLALRNPWLLIHYPNCPDTVSLNASLSLPQNTTSSFNFLWYNFTGQHRPSPKNGFWRRKNLFLGEACVAQWTQPVPLPLPLEVPFWGAKECFWLAGKVAIPTHYSSGAGVWGLERPLILYAHGFRIGRVLSGWIACGCACTCP